MVKKSAITIGCVAPTVIHARSAEKYLIGKQLSGAVAAEVGRIASLDVSPIDDVRSSAEYRSHLVMQIVERAINHIRLGEVNGLIPENPVILQTPSKQQGNISIKESQEIKSGEMILAQAVKK